WFLVGLHETGRIEGQILELALDARLFERRDVDLAEFAPRRVEVAPEAMSRLLGLAPIGRTATEQFRCRVELLVDLQPGDKTQLLVIVLVVGVLRAHYLVVWRPATKTRPV